MLILWIRADNQKITARVDSAMSRACRQNGHIAWQDFHFAPILPTENQARFPSCESENLVSGRVVVVVVVDSIAPLRRPSIARERSLEICSGVASAG
jgi:hypothetical protein